MRDTIPIPTTDPPSHCLDCGKLRPLRNVPNFIEDRMGETTPICECDPGKITRTRLTLEGDTWAEAIRVVLSDPPDIEAGWQPEVEDGTYPRPLLTRLMTGEMGS